MDATRLDCVKPEARLASDRRKKVDGALGQLRSYVQTKGLKNSRVRERIVEAATVFDGHFTVDELVRALRSQGVRNVHTATIYRCMPLLIEAGLIEPALVAGGESQVYESAFERAHHDHLVCKNCGCIVEFYSETLETLQREIAERHGFRLTDHVHELRGICARCERAAAAVGE